MATAERLLNDAIGHVVDLHFYANETVRSLISLLNASDAKLFAKLVAALEDLPPSKYTAARLTDALHGVEALNKRAYATLADKLDAEVRALAKYEVAYQHAAFVAATSGKANKVLWDQVYAAAVAEPFQGRLLSEWADGMPAQRMRRITDTINIGYTQGLTVDQMVRNLRGTKAANYSDGLINADRRNIDSITRTAISHITSTAREAFYDANPTLISGKIWVSTLDTRTTPACQIRDGKHYTSDNKPRGHDIPWLSGPGQLHWSCRSTSVPLTAHAAELGFDPTFGSRASKDGPVAASISFGDWIRNQSAARQDEVLGPTRAKLMRQTGMTLDRFFTDRGRFLTLEQLRERNSAAFSAAGV
jgi:hypothetical protein